MLARIACRHNFALNAALAKAARHQNPVNAGQLGRRASFFQHLSLQPDQLYLGVIERSRMR